MCWLKTPSQADFFLFQADSKREYDKVDLEYAFDGHIHETMQSLSGINTRQQIVSIPNC